MASIKDTPGKLYFIKEQDLLTGEISPYVKIGLVRNEKDTAKRILEHQTGNPRRIYDHKTLESPFVEHLETLIHYVYAEQWITGEWFHMNNEQLEDAISRAEKFIEEQQAYAERIRRAYALKAELDDTRSREPSKEELKLHAKFISAKLELDRWTAKAEILAYRLKKSCGERMGIEGVCSYTYVNPTKAFDDKGFAEKYPDLYADFQKEETKFSQKFNVAGKLSLKKEDPELFDQRSELSKAEYPEPISGEKLAITDEIGQIHADFIHTQSKVRILGWEKDKLEIELKCAIDKAQEITGVCTWKRNEKISKKLDKKALKDAHPELYAEFEFEKENSPKFSANAWRPYRY